MNNLPHSEENTMQYARYAIAEKGIDAFKSNLSKTGYYEKMTSSGTKTFVLSKAFSHQVYIRNMAYEYISLLKKFADAYAGDALKVHEVNLAKEYGKMFEALHQIYAHGLDNKDASIGKWSYEGIILVFSESIGYSTSFYKTKKPEDVMISRISAFQNKVETAREITKDIATIIQQKQLRISPAQTPEL